MKTKRKPTARPGSIVKPAGPNINRSPATAASGAASPLPGWKRWLFRTVLVLVPTPLLLLAAEGILRAGGYGYDPALLVKDPTGQYYHENDKYLWRFYSPRTKLQPHPFRVAVQKPADTTRVVILGESAALGTPEPSYGFWRMLDQQLQRDFPERKFEIINAAMRGINSHIIRSIAEDCRPLGADLFLIYMGNNEVVGLHAPGPESSFLTDNIRLAHALDWIKGTRCGQLFVNLVAKQVADKFDENQDMEFFRAHRLAADDPRRQAVYRNFQGNLRDICESIGNTGAKALLCTIPVNLKDCAPLGSMHRAGFSASDRAACETEIAQAGAALANHDTNEAIKHVEAALARDDHYAEWHFQLAEAVTGDPARRRREFELARDWDALQFRADGPINAAIRQVAADRHLALLDAEKIFSQSEQCGGIPGRELFYEHVHLRFEGDHLLAKNLYPAMLNELGLKAPAAAASDAKKANGFPSRDHCARRLAYTSLNEFQLEHSISELLGTPPFLDQYQHGVRLQQYREAFTNRFIIRNAADIQPDLDRYTEAIRDATNDWHLHYNLGNYYSTIKRYDRAAEEFGIATRLMPHYQQGRIKLAAALAKSGRPNEAISTLEEGLKQNPRATHLQAALRQARDR